MKEKLSALMDGELSELEERHILNELANDPTLRASWERYHLMRAAITRQLDTVAPPDLVDRIYARLQDAGAARPAYPQLAVGLAVAAGISALAVVGIQSLQSPSPSLPTPLAANQATPAEPSEGPLNVYLVGHNEVMPTAGMGGMLPYVRVVTYDRDK